MKGDGQPIDARTWMTTKEMQPYEKVEERAENPPLAFGIRRSACECSQQ